MTLDFLLTSYLGTMDFSKPSTYAMMAAVSIPEQLALYTFAPELPLYQRLSASAVMFVVHFGTNGFVPKASSLRMEMPWILATGAYIKYGLGASTEAALAQLAGDSLMVLALR